MAEENHHDHHHLLHHHKDEDQLINGTTYNYLGGEEAGSGYDDQTKTVYNSGGDSFGQTGSAYSTEGVGSGCGQTKIDQHSGGGYGQTKTEECSGGGYGQTKTDDYSVGDYDNTKADECPSDGYSQSVGTAYSTEKAGTGAVTGTDTYVTTEGARCYGSQTSGGMETTDPRKEEYEKEEMHHKNKERVDELGTAAAGALAMYEKHVPKKDPEHEHRHKIEEEIAAAAAVGSGGYAFHEHHEKEVAEEEEEMAEGKKHRHLFG